jgi:hypothetical protein
MITTAKQRRQATVFLAFVAALFEKSRPDTNRIRHWAVAQVQGRLVIFYAFGSLDLNMGEPFKTLFNGMYDAIHQCMEGLIKEGIHPVIMNVVFPVRVGRTVSCDFLIDEPTILIPTLEATQHNLTAVTCAEGLLPLTAFADIIKKAITTSEWARPFRI